MSAPLTELSANTTYHFRIVATNPGGTSKGGDGTFKTLPNAPTVVTKAASAVAQTTATVNATVNPHGGEVTKCEFEYGTTNAYGSTASCASLPGSGTSPVAVSASLTGLTANTTYHFRISATNAGGTSKGADETFTTLPGAPTVVTKPASSVTQTTATLNATVNPNGVGVTKCEFEYGTNTEYKSTPVACSALPGSGTSPVAVSASVTGLTANTTYHVRISATSGSGTSKGADETFKTTANAPAVVTGSASTAGPTLATLNATVNPNGGEVSECTLEYGTTISYGASAPCAPSPGSGTSPIAVSAAVTGLSESNTYHFRISATNAGGTSKGSDQTFKTAPARRYSSNGSLVGSEPVTVNSWGTLTLKTVVGGAGEITCHTAEAGTIANPEGGGAGVGSIQLLVSYDCESTTCPYSSVVSAEALPWPSILESEGTAIRSRTTGVKLKTDCQKEGKSEGSVTFAGRYGPSVHKGASALHPGFLEFDAGSGTLEAQGSKGAVLGQPEGEVRTMGYEEQELIAAR